MIGLLQQGFNAQSRALTDFGYPDATPELVRQHYEVWKRGNRLDDVIFQFNAEAFDEHPAIFGKRGNDGS